ncbi:MAG: 2OG-Fe(II) oxygenase [Pseudomonadota bacterium]
MNRRLTDFVQVYDDVLSPDLCERITRLFDRSRVVRREMEDVKSFDELVIDGVPEWMQIHLTLEQLKEQALGRYQSDCPGEFPDSWDFEAFRIKRYLADRGDEFRVHADGYNLSSAKRFLVCFWYLNDVADGGETVFPRLGLRVRPKAGRLIMFPPFWMFDHAGLAPVSGPKYIISTYFLFAE